MYHITTRHNASRHVFRCWLDHTAAGLLDFVLVGVLSQTKRLNEGSDPMTSKGRWLLGVLIAMCAILAGALTLSLLNPRVETVTKEGADAFQ